MEQYKTHILTSNLASQYVIPAFQHSIFHYSSFLGWNLFLRAARPLTLRRRLHFRDAGYLTQCDELLGRAGREHMHRPGDDSGPPGLVARAKTRAIVTMKIFIEQDEIAPVRVLLKLAAASVHRSSSIPVSKKNAGQPARDLFRHLI